LPEWHLSKVADHTLPMTGELKWLQVSFYQMLKLMLSYFVGSKQ
jgi:hypothetical protein